MMTIKIVLKPHFVYPNFMYYMYVKRKWWHPFSGNNYAVIWAKNMDEAFIEAYKCAGIKRVEIRTFE